MGLVPPGTEIGVFFKIVLFNIVFFSVASTKSSNIAGILSFGGLLGLIRKRLVGFRLDFLAGFLQVSLAGFLQVWLTFLPSSCLCSRCVSLGPTAISYASCMGFLLYRLRFVSRAAPCSDRQNVWWRDWIITLYKLTSLFHQDGKGSVSWSLNIINVNIKINISIVITRASGHETSHISEAEIC